MSKHTPEPWESEIIHIGERPIVGVRSEELPGNFRIAVCGHADDSASEQSVADANRIAVCINACEGAPDTMRPGAVKALANALERMLADYEDASYEWDTDIRREAERNFIEPARQALRQYHGGGE